MFETKSLRFTYATEYVAVHIDTSLTQKLKGNCFKIDLRRNMN